MDTDSAYNVISGERVEDLIKPETMCGFDNDKCNWFPRIDTVEHAKYDKRTPGLLKVEWEGDGIFIFISPPNFESPQSALTIISAKRSSSHNKFSRF